MSRCSLSKLYVLQAQTSSHVGVNAWPLDRPFSVNLRPFLIGGIDVPARAGWTSNLRLTHLRFFFKNAGLREMAHVQAEPFKLACRYSNFAQTSQAPDGIRRDGMWHEHVKRC